MFTESDESLYILLLKNNAEDYVNIYDQKRKILRKEVRPKYTKVDSVNKQFKGWGRKGITRCNDRVHSITIYRECDWSKKMEIEMKSRYAKIAGKLNKNNSGDSDNTDTDDSDGGDLEAYQFFLVDFNCYKQRVY